MVQGIKTYNMLYPISFSSKNSGLTLKEIDHFNVKYKQGKKIAIKKQQLFKATLDQMVCPTLVQHWQQNLVKHPEN